MIHLGTNKWRWPAGRWTVPSFHFFTSVDQDIATISTSEVQKTENTKPSVRTGTNVRMYVWIAELRFISNLNCRLLQSQSECLRSYVNNAYQVGVYVWIIPQERTSNTSGKVTVVKYQRKTVAPSSRDGQQILRQKRSRLNEDDDVFVIRFFFNSI